MSLHKLRSLAFRLLNDRAGNFAVMTALLLPLLIPVAGIAIDLSGMMNERAKMRDVADAGALAAATALAQNHISEGEARRIALDFLKGHSTSDIDYSSGANVTITSTGSGVNTVYRVTVDTNYTYPLNAMTKMLGVVDSQIATSSTTVSGQKVIVQKPLSVFLVLDRSGSMRREATDGTIKLDGLKDAVDEMGKVFARIDPARKYIRTGAQAFSSYWVAPSLISWDPTSVVDYADGFTADGHTIPLAALQVGRISLNSTIERNAHRAKNGGVPKKVLIYMTDGQNWLHDGQTDAEQEWVDNEALNRCRAAKASGIEVYTIGFEINAHTERYLKECSSGDHYFYFPSGAGGLIETFKKISEEISSDLKSRITS